MKENNSGLLAHEVNSILRRNESSWSDIPPYELFSRDYVIGHMRDIHRAVTIATHDSGYLGADIALDQTEIFVNNAFDVYDSKTESPQYDWVFAVPARTSKDQGNEYASEITPFLPMLDPRFGVDADIRKRAVIGLVPSVIETYRGSQKNEQGAIVYTPLYSDMQRDYNDRKRSMDVIDRSINATADFTHRRLGASVMGLGAHLPALTRYGKKIKIEGLKTTTGHGGTVYLIAETVKAVKQPDHTVGVLGAIGRIGSSSVELLLDQYDQPINIYDTSDSFEHTVVKNGWSTQTQILKSELALLEKSDVIVSAVTTPVDLDLLDPERRLDLQGKIIIDDSQPGAFSREQIEERGGLLVWVVGQDTSDQQALHRESGYNFGDMAGIYGDGAVWGCEAEAGAILMTGRHELAVNSHVIPEIALAIGALCKEVGIDVARPFQSFGRPIRSSYGL